MPCYKLWSNPCKGNFSRNQDLVWFYINILPHLYQNSPSPAKYEERSLLQEIVCLSYKRQQHIEPVYKTSYTEAKRKKIQEQQAKCSQSFNVGSQKVWISL